MVWAFAALLGSQLLLGVVYATWASLRLGSAHASGSALTTEITTVASSGPGLLLGIAVEWGIFAGVPYLAARRKGSGSLAREFGFTLRWRDLPMGVGLAALMQGVLIGAQMLLAQVGVRLSGADNTGLVTGNTGIWLLLMTLGAALGAPVVEELFFRGLFLRALLRRLGKVDLRDPDAATAGRLRRRVGTVASVLLSSAVFGLLHSPITSGGSAPLTDVLALVAETGLLGAVFAVVAIRTRRLGIGIAAHMAFNASSVALALLLGH